MARAALTLRIISAGNHWSRITLSMINRAGSWRISSSTRVISAVMALAALTLRIITAGRHWSGSRLRIISAGG